MNNNDKMLLEQTNASKRTQYVLTALGLHTVEDLKLMYLLNTIPSIGTNIDLYPFINASLLYTKEINEEVKRLLKNLCDIEELDHVGVK